MSDLMFVRTPHGLEIAQKATEGLVPVTLKAPTESSNPETGIPVSEMDSGPWTVIDYPHNTNVGVNSSDPNHGARLKIYGNFETNEEKVAYAEWLAESLNRLASQDRALGLMRDALAEIRAHQLLVTKGQFVERSVVYAIADRALKIDGDLND